MSASSEKSPQTSTAGSLRTSIVRGAMWTVGALWGTRGLGILSTTILAHLLAPQDFGLVAMATVVSGFLNVLFTFGIDIALIQNADATRSDWDSAWTLRLLQGTVLAALVALLAPVTARFYAEPRVTPIMLMLAAGILVASFENIGVVSFRRDLQFHRAFSYAMIRKIFQVSVAVPLAFLLRDYWALLIATLATQAFTAVFSYVVHPFRPRWSMARARAILGFSSRLAFVNLAQYFTLEGERLIIAPLTGAVKTGLYYMANEVAYLPTAELSGSMAQATFPGLVKLKHDPDRLRGAYLNVVGVVAMYALPAGLGIAVVAPDLVPVALGPQWVDAIPLLQLLAVAGALRAVASPAHNLLVVLGHLNNALFVTWLQTALQIVGLFAAIAWFGLVGAAALNCALAGLTLVLYVGQTVRCAELAAIDHLRVLWRPLLAAAVMVAASAAFSQSIATPAISLVCAVAAGVASYTLVALTLWLLCGRPRGPESHLIEIIGTRLGFAQ